MPYKDPEKRRASGRASSAKWRANNPDRARAIRRASDAKWRENENNREKSRTVSRKWRANNREKSRATSREWHAHNPGRAKFHSVRREVKSRQATAILRAMERFDPSIRTLVRRCKHPGRALLHLLKQAGVEIAA